MRGHLTYVPCMQEAGPRGRREDLKLNALGDHLLPEAWGARGATPTGQTSDGTEQRRPRRAEGGVCSGAHGVTLKMRPIRPQTARLTKPGKKAPDGQGKGSRQMSRLSEGRWGNRQNQAPRGRGKGTGNRRKGGVSRNETRRRKTRGKFRPGNLTSALELTG